jgi:hypothetical protein
VLVSGTVLDMFAVVGAVKSAVVVVEEEEVVDVLVVLPVSYTSDVKLRREEGA